MMAALVRIDGPNQIARIGVIELEARTLVEHVRVDPVGPKQRNPLLALGALPFQPRPLRRQRDDFLIEFLPRIQPIFAGIGVDAEIADHQRRHRVEGKPGEQGFESGARDHGPEDAVAPVNAILTTGPSSLSAAYLLCFSTWAA